ncbi:hypothetical protein [Nonomuraea sp. B19D2]|uniref:hypothetical protein n=1 Tax=Nonomuraea sp. B19D2 TaxID=3159561 RepID=UPI0032DAC749
MTESVGAVYLTAAQDRAVFMTGGELAVLGETLDKLQARPAVAGPPLEVEALTRLSRTVNLGQNGPSAPVVVLSAGEQRWLELVRCQEAIRQTLPLRLRQVCTACGSDRILDPARRAKTAKKADATRTEPSGQSLMHSAELFNDDHPFLAVLNLLLNVDWSEEPAAEEQEPCDRCDGDEFDRTPITFCPECRALRDESVLVRCSECGFDFLDGATADPLWTPVADAMARRNHATLRSRAGEFENALWPGQLEALVGAVGGDEQLVAMCRCARPGEIGRYVALLLTTEQLVWARESAFSEVKSGKVRWADMRAVREHGDQGDKYEWGVEVETADGPPLAFTDFRGVGVGLGDAPPEFTADHLLRFMADLHRDRKPLTAKRDLEP